MNVMRLQPGSITRHPLKCLKTIFFNTKLLLNGEILDYGNISDTFSKNLENSGIFLLKDLLNIFPV